MLRRSFAMMRGRHIWMVVAENLNETQRFAGFWIRNVFVPDLLARRLLMSRQKNAAVVAAENLSLFVNFKLMTSSILSWPFGKEVQIRFGNLKKGKAISSVSTRRFCLV